VFFLALYDRKDGAACLVGGAGRQRGFKASATKNMIEPPIAAIQKKSISKASLKSDGPFYKPIFRIF
jgi:hypothetical protein